MSNSEFGLGNTPSPAEVPPVDLWHPTETTEEDQLPIALPDAVKLLRSIEVESDILRLYRSVASAQWQEFLQRESGDPEVIDFATKLRDDVERAYTEYRMCIRNKRPPEEKNAAFLHTLDLELRLMLQMNLSPE